MQPIKLSSAAGLCAGRGCALIRQLANTTLTEAKLLQTFSRILELLICILLVSINYMISHDDKF